MQEEATKKNIRIFAKAEIAKQVKFLQNCFKLGDDWQPALKLSFDKSLKNSRGGRNVLRKPFIVLSLVGFLNEINGFLEYDEYSANMLIGSFKSKSWQLCLTSLISHELAHAVQFTIPAVMTNVEPVCQEQARFYALGKKGGNHGELFRLIYKTLRIAFVNDSVEQYCMGIEPLAIVKPKHELAGAVFHHANLGKCTITNFYLSGRYPYEFMDVAGVLYKSTRTTMEVYATFGYYNNEC